MRSEIQLKPKLIGHYPEDGEANDWIKAAHTRYSEKLKEIIETKVEPKMLVNVLSNNDDMITFKVNGLKISVIRNNFDAAKGMGFLYRMWVTHLAPVPNMKRRKETNIAIIDMGKNAGEVFYYSAEALEVLL